MFLRNVVCLLLSVFLCAWASQVVKQQGFKYISRTWPHLQGGSTDEVTAEILKEIPGLEIRVVSAKYGVSASIASNVVFLYEDEDGIVVNIPETVQRIKVEIKTWPTAVGLTADSAKDLILKDKPDAWIVVLQQGSPVTDDLRLNRVRIFVNSHHVVVETPQTG